MSNTQIKLGCFTVFRHHVRPAQEPAFLVRKITIGDIHFHISISFSISSSLLNVFYSGWVSSNVFECL